jgi:hypothetical protein
MSARTILNPPVSLSNGTNTTILLERLNIGTNTATYGNASIVQSSTSPYTLLINNGAATVNISSPTQIPTLLDSTGSSGTAGQVPTANGTGGWFWA